MNQDEVYAFLKKNAGTKFKRRHLQKYYPHIFGNSNTTFINVMSALLKNLDCYPGINEEYTNEVAENGRVFSCKQWWYDSEGGK